MSDESFIQVAPDSIGKKMRTRVDSIPQPDGTVATVHTEVTQGRPEWDESARDVYMRQLAENSLLALTQIVNLLAASSRSTTPYEDTL